ncbi:MAG TPA: hypothetical protein VIK88_02095 [Candidatus Bathyarchaeia archaeon]
MVGKTLRDLGLIRIVRLSDPEQFATAVGVQRSAWGLEDSLAIPSHVLIAAQHHSGLVLGAYDGRKMVGVLFGFTALDGKKPYHYSHVTGVVREYQSRGVGFRLKLAQRDYVIQQGQSLVKWTYDPLQASNAYFNIGKLGAVCRTYKRNLYGSLNDSLNRGRLTDRFEVEWRVKSRRVLARIRSRHKALKLVVALASSAEMANITERLTFGVRRAVASRLNLKRERLLVEIPKSIVRVRESSLQLARSWTMNLRRVFENYFPKGYVATDVIVEGNGDGRRVFYLLERNPRL